MKNRFFKLALPLAVSFSAAIASTALANAGDVSTVSPGGWVSGTIRGNSNNNCSWSVTVNPSTGVVTIDIIGGNQIKTITVGKSGTCVSQLRALSSKQLASVRKQLKTLWSKRTDQSESAIRDAFTALNQADSQYQSASAETESTASQ